MTPNGITEATTFLRRLTPPQIYEYSLVPLSTWFHTASPFDFVYSLYPERIDDFGNDVIGALFEREALRPRYAELLKFTSRACANPDALRWAIVVLRHACIDTLLAKFHARNPVPETLGKPQPPASLSVSSLPARPGPNPPARKGTPKPA